MCVLGVCVRACILVDLFVDLIWNVRKPPESRYLISNMLVRVGCLHG